MEIGRIDLNDADLVSVVVPVYNGAATLDETLSSVRGQTWKALEIIVVDDGSTDRSVDIAAEHVRQDSRVQIVKQANAGVAAARNLGIALARSQYIAPVDADDLWAPDKIELQMAEIQEAGETMGLVYTWFIIIDDKSRGNHVVAPTPMAGCSAKCVGPTLWVTAVVPSCAALRSSRWVATIPPSAPATGKAARTTCSICLLRSTMSWALSANR